MNPRLLDVTRLAFLMLAIALTTTQTRAQSTDTAGSADMMRPGITGVVAMSIDLSGTAEVPGPGDADGTGEAFLMVHPNDGEVCYALSVEGTQPPMAAHIHEGAVDESGGPVVPLPVDSGLNGCVTAETELLERISQNPGDFYVNVHTEEHPAGAIRGQLIQ